MEVAAGRMLPGTEELCSCFSLLLDMPPLEQNAVPVLCCRCPQSWGPELSLAVEMRMGMRYRVPEEAWLL